MRTYIKIIMMFLFLMLGCSMRGEAFFISSLPDDGIAVEVAGDGSDSSYQLLSSEKDLNNVDDPFARNYYHRGDMELGEKTVAQGFVYNSMRIRKSNDISFFFRNIMYQLSCRDGLLAQGKSNFFYSSINHCVLPSCQYYIFTLRRILI